MYHIKQDQRSMVSAKMLLDGLSECLSVKKFKDISISELCKTAHVSRTTFYRLFDSTEDLLQYALDSLTDKASEQFHTDAGTTIEEFLQFYLSFIRENTKLYEMVIYSERTDLVTRSLKRMKSKGDIPEFQNRFTEVERDYVIAILISLSTTLNQVNVSRGKKESPDEMVAIIKKLVKLFAE